MDPAVKGTTTVIQSAIKSKASVKRIVLNLLRGRCAVIFLALYGSAFAHSLRKDKLHSTHCRSELV